MNDASISEIDVLNHIAKVEKELEDLKHEFIDALQSYLATANAGEAPDELRKQFQEVHQAAVKYFSRSEKWVGETSMLKARHSPSWNLSLTENCYAVLRSYLTYWDMLKSESEKIGDDLQARYKPHSRAYNLMQAMVRVYYPKRWADLRESFHAAGLPTSGFDNKHFWKEVIVEKPDDLKNPAAHGKMTPQLWALFGFGVVFIILLLILVVAVDDLNSTQNFYFRVVMALAAGAIGALIPGLFTIDAKVLRNSIRAGGAAAFFVAVYFMNPPEIATETKSQATSTEQRQPEKPENKD